LGINESWISGLLANPDYWVVKPPRICAKLTETGILHLGEKQRHIQCWNGTEPIVDGAFSATMFLTSIFTE
jgi:hypothetical protein